MNIVCAILLVFAGCGILPLWFIAFPCAWFLRYILAAFVGGIFFAMFCSGSRWVRRSRDDYR